MSQAQGRAVIYLRVSSAQQADKDYNAEGFSIPGQREACLREADKLDAEVVEEFVDRGESARTADRPALKAMLDRLKQGGIDFVIVHKVDRLARNRADDVQIVMSIRQAGAQVVSASENIDETPSGLLLHGIMSSIAEFYSANLSAEVLKGSTQKAKSGGTPFRAPLGYLNSRAIVDDREIRVVTIDPIRGPLIRELFCLYASGDYALSDLAGIMEARGLRSRPTRKSVSKALGVNRLDGILRNPYYKGIVNYRGKTYKGHHEPLVDEDTFQTVQDLLDSKRLSGERSWRHHHHLRGSLYCAECRSRLTYNRARGNGGLYEYFVCLGTHRGKCSQGHHRVDAIEAAIERRYETIQLDAKMQARIRERVRLQVQAISELALAQVGKAEGTLTRLASEERKLLAAHYADQISETLFAEEQSRISRERVGAARLIEKLSVENDQVLEALDVALALTGDVQKAYRQAASQERRLFNQAFFERLEISTEEVTGHELAEPFADIMDVEAELRELTEQTPSPDVGWAAGHFASLPESNGAANERTSDPCGVEGSNLTSLVRLRGVEPPRPFGHKPLKLARLPIPPQPHEGRGILGEAGVARRCRPGRGVSFSPVSRQPSARAVSVRT